jgi:flagellar M-ring protein FliF
MPTDQINKLLRAFTIRQRWTMGLVSVLLLAAIYGIVQWQRNANFSPLFTDLAPEDASPVVQKLKEGGVAYRLTNNGATILVPDEKVAELRLEMAGDGLPKSGRLGFELFDKTNFGITEFAEHVNYRRALEGELERSVMSVSEIEQARVHISLPQESVFTEQRQAAKASVLVKIRRGAFLPDSAIPAITNLVASAVEGLTPENVSVLDMRGNLLSRPKRPENTDETSTGALEYRQKVERDLATKLDSTLEPLLGAGRYRTAVSAETEMKSGEQSEETFDPEHSVMVSSQKTEDISSQMRPAEGVPGTASALPDNGQRPSSVGGTTSRKTENVNYQTSHTVKRLVLPQGEIKRLSVSVLLDYDVADDGGKRVLNPPNPDRVKVIHDVVAAAAGLNTERGDQLIVESLPFESTLNFEPPVTDGQPTAPGKRPAAGKQKAIEQVKQDPKLLIGVAGLVVLVLTGGVFAIYKMKSARKKVPEIRTQAQLPYPSEPAAGRAASAPEISQPAATTSQDSVEMSTQFAALGAAHLEALTTQARAVTMNNAEVCAGVLRGWLKEEGA